MDGSPLTVIDEDGLVTYDQCFLEPLYADSLLNRLVADVDWKQDFINLHGRRVAVPRLTAWYGDKDAVYIYSKIEKKPKAWTAELLELRDKLASTSGIVFNSVLLNRYRGGEDSVSWHADNEPELGLNPIIASVSLGAIRTFQLQHQVFKGKRCSIPLGHGSLLLMSGATQTAWKHRIPKERTVRGERINLTFRVVGSLMRDKR